MKYEVFVELEESGELGRENLYGYELSPNPAWAYNGGFERLSAAKAEAAAIWIVLGVRTRVFQDKTPGRMMVQYG